jgi:hypothetical protein
LRDALAALLCGLAAVSRVFAPVSQTSDDVTTNRQRLVL